MPERSLRSGGQQPSMMVADDLVPNRHQVISNHHADLTVTAAEHEHNIYIQYVYNILVTK